MAPTSLRRHDRRAGERLARLAPFSFLGPDHPLAPRIERFRAAIAARAPDATAATVHADLTLRPGPDGGLVLHRAYWSRPGRGARRLPRDHARATTPSRDRATWLEFPEDPELPALGELASRPRASCATCRCGVARCAPRPAAGPRSSRSSARTARPRPGGCSGPCTARWATAAPASSVAGPARARRPPARRTRRAVLPGDDLAGLIDADDGPGLLRRAGALHRAMHAADVPGVPAEDPAAALAELRADARWVAFALPEHAAAVARGHGRARAARARPRPRRPPSATATSSPRSCSSTATRWAITDFDGARIGDPHRDLAIWLAALTFDVPALGTAAEAGDERRSSAPRPRTSTATARTTSAACAGTAPPPRSTTRRSRSRRTATTRRASPAACGVARACARGARMTEPPGRRPRAQLDRASAACREVAWQLMRRLPADRFDQRVYVPAPRKGRGGHARAACTARLEEHGVPVSFADASGSLGVVAQLCDWLVARGRRPRAHPLLPAEPPGPPRRGARCATAACGSSPTTTTSTTTSGRARGRSRSSAA